MQTPIIFLTLLLFNREKLGDITVILEIYYCPFCGSNKIYLEKWSAGYSWFCRNCKREFLVEITQNGPHTKDDLFYNSLFSLMEESSQPVKQRSTKPRRKKTKKRKNTKKRARGG